MGRKKKTESTENKTIKLEKFDSNKKYNVSDGFYYILGIVLSLVLIFATEELLSTVNYLFVVIFSIIAVIKIINFIMNKEYEKKDYSGVILGIMCLWLGLFTFKYGQFLFLELLPVLVSLLLFLMGVSSLIKFFNYKITANVVVTIISIILGIVLIFVPKSIMYIFFKITGIYILVMVILDFINYKKTNEIDND
ncbi:MAG: DUF308 domain-containing protein [Bacilli bacterium]